jgi:competence protein ComEC
MSKPAIALGVALLLVLMACFPIAPGGGGTSMTFLDVGEGDAILLRGRSGYTTLIDGGPDPQEIMIKLRSRRISRVDLMVLSHPHADHCAGLVEVMRRMPVGRLLGPGVPTGSSGVYKQLVDAAQERGVPVMPAKEGQRISSGEDVDIDVLYAPSQIERPPENLNDCSIVAMAHAAGADILLCGDIEAEGQRKLLAAHPSVQCDVIKVPHQGAANAATEELFDASKPALAAISVGRDNKYGHPSSKCMDLLAARGVRVLRTDLNGDIELSFDNGRIGQRSSRR